MYSALILSAPQFRFSSINFHITGHTQILTLIGYRYILKSRESLNILHFYRAWKYATYVIFIYIIYVYREYRFIYRYTKYDCVWRSLFTGNA